ncbi:cytochrome c3 family protein [Persephonella sp.]
MILRRILFFLFLPVFAYGFEVLAPVKYSIHEEEFVSVSVKLSKEEIDNGISLEFRIGKGYFMFGMDPERDVYCKSMRIKPGKNILEVIYTDQNGKQIKKSVEFFRYSILYKESEEPPSKFEEIPFHQKKNEEKCAKCHNMGTQLEDIVPEKPEKSPCYSCHKVLTSRKKVHAPSANWLCTYCHKDVGLSYKRFDTPFPISQVCFSCHEYREKVWMNKKYVHGPTSTGQCNICHNPHSSNNIFFLKKPIFNLCTSCHAEKASGTHVLAGFVFGKSHPTHGRPDPSRPGRELVCSSCHNPHASNYKYMFNNDYTGDRYLCQMCHKK